VGHPPRDRPEDEDPGAPVELPITGELDLHSFAPRDVEDVVTDYLDACRERGLPEVRLVHGRGKGVQRAMVRRIVSARDDVASFADAPPGSGGWGATLVRFRTPEVK
jgi:DNA-nicking Smr family endonuclease